MPERRAPLRWAIAIACAFGLLYAYDFFEALANLVEVPAQLAAYNEFLLENDLRPQSVPWTVLIANLAVPPLAFAAAFWLGRRRSLLQRALAYLLGLVVVAAAALTFTALV